MPYRGFGSPLRRALRAARARENVLFAAALTADQRAELPLHLRPSPLPSVYTTAIRWGDESSPPPPDDGRR